MSRKPHIRCSSLEQLLRCPGSRKLIEATGAQSESGAAAHEGNWCHHEAARRLIAEQDAIEPEGGLQAPDLPEGWKPNNWSHWLVSYYLDVIASWTDYDQALIVEEELTAEFARFVLTGHIDLFAITPDGKKAVGFDLKTGPNPVTAAEENAQVLGYMVLLALNYPDLEEIEFLIVQPRNNVDEGYDRVTHVKLSGLPEALREDDEIEKAVAYLEQQINAALDDENTIQTGVRQCMYCPVKLVCPAIKEELRMAKITLTPEHLSELRSRPDPEEFIEIETSRKLLEPVFADSKRLLKEYLEYTEPEVRTSDGRRAFLTERRGKRTITDSAAAAAALQDLPDDLYYRCLSFQPTEVEKSLAEALDLPKTSKKGESAESEYQRRLGEVTQQPTLKILKLVEP